jgi:hypothetical protein
VGVVATTFVRDARSKRVEGVTRESKSPPSRREREKGGAPVLVSSYVKVPRAFRATRRLRWVTAKEAAGKAFCAIASCRMEKAGANTSS